MKAEKAKSIVANLERYVHHDRIFLNNPVVMQGMGLAPLVIIATNGQNALMLCAAVALLLTPTRVISSLLYREVKDPLLRAMGYCGVSAAVYVPVYRILSALFGTSLLQLGIYLPMLVVEPIIIYRFGRVAEPVRKALSKGLRITVGYALILLLCGCVREVLAAGTLFGAAVAPRGLLPLLQLPAGGFLLLGVVCAVWRGAVNAWKKHVAMEAKNGL